MAAVRSRAERRAEMAEAVAVVEPIDQSHTLDGESGPRTWWRIMDTKIGIVPIPVFIVIVALICA